ncbi:MAG: hypothetical protein ACR2LM_16945 [Pyrinomonadaceae bacterium]
MVNKLKPALFGGLVTGILSVVPIISSCCCIWAIAGGGLASFLYIKSSPTPVPISEGATIGAMSGAIGSAIYFIIGLPIALMFGVGQMEETFRRSGMEVPVAGAALAIVTVFFVIVLLMVFSTLGGIIGVPIFEKRKGTGDAPPPPQDFTAGPGGSYGAGL